MPDRCCVPCCESNYCSTKEIQGYISVFRFPSNPQLFNKWVKSIPRENWAPSKRSVVCIKHFEPHFILTSYHYQTASGQTQTYHYDRPKLKPEAYPTIFLGAPKYLTKLVRPPRKSPDERRNQIKDREIHSQNEFQETQRKEDVILNFDFLKQDLASYINKFNTDYCPYYYLHMEFKIKPTGGVVIYKMNYELMKCDFYVEISEDLVPKIYVQYTIMSIEEVQLIIGAKVLSKWSKLKEVLEHICLKNYAPTIDSALETLKKHFQKLINIISKTTASEIQIAQLNFLEEQIFLLFKQQKRYSSKMLMISLLISLQSKKCYEALRANSILQLPHPKYLQQLTSSLKVSPDKSLQNNHFLKVISSKLSEKWVVLEADKIYVKEAVEYKSGARNY
jgi:hypothetical protein